jgi:hypothetical protein
MLIIIMPILLIMTNYSDEMYDKHSIQCACICLGDRRGLPLYQLREGKVRMFGCFRAL